MNAEELSEEYEAVDGYFCKICDRPSIFLRKWQKAFIEAYHSRALIENGGFHSYLCEHGPNTEKSAEAHQEIGLPESAKLIRKAIQYWKDFGGMDLPGYGNPEKFRELYDNDLIEIEKKFFNLEEQDHAHLYQVLKRNKKIKS